MVILEGFDPNLSSEVFILVHTLIPRLRKVIGLQVPMITGVDQFFLETLRVLVEVGFRPKRTIEFHWYVAGDAGLLWSQDVSQYYKHKGLNVIAMTSFDMVGFNQGKNDISIVTDKQEKFAAAYCDWQIMIRPAMIKCARTTFPSQILVT